MRRQPAAFAILVGGSVAGACDITYAILFTLYRGGTATRLLQSVASGVLGNSAFDGGAPTAALGMGLHFMNAYIIATIFYLASRRLTWMTRHAVPAGIAYGFGVYWVMNLVVLPLSAFPLKWKFTALAGTTGLIVHMFLIGLPIALAARAATRNAQNSTLEG